MEVRLLVAPHLLLFCACVSAQATKMYACTCEATIVHITWSKSLMTVLGLSVFFFLSFSGDLWAFIYIDISPLTFDINISNLSTSDHSNLRETFTHGSFCLRIFSHSLSMRIIVFWADIININKPRVWDLGITHMIPLIKAWNTKNVWLVDRWKDN